MQQYIVFGIMLFMIVSFMIGKWSYGLVMMACCTALAVTGIMKIPEAFAGFANKNLIMIAGVFIISNAFGKTGAIANLQKQMMKMQSGKSAFVVMSILLLVIAGFAQFLPASATMTVVIMLVGVLSSGGELCASRLLLPVAALTTMWTSKIPIGMGATSFTRVNAFIEAYDEAYCIGITDVLKAAIIPLAVLSVYTLFAYKFLPKREIDESKMKKTREQQAIPRKQEMLIYVVFVVVMCCMFMNRVLGDLIYLVPAVGAIVLLYCRIMDIDEAKKILSGDIIFMLAGALVLTNAMSETGAGELIGSLILKLLGGSPNQSFVVIAFAGITLLITNFMNNTTTYNVLIPLAVSTSIAAGFDPRPAAMAVATCSYCAILLPSASGAAAIAYAAGGYRMKETLKFTLPFILLCWISAAAGILLFF